MNVRNPIVGSASTTLPSGAPTRGVLEAELSALEVLPFGDVGPFGERARVVEQLAEGMGLEDLVVRAQLVAAHVAVREGDVPGLGRAAERALGWATATGNRHVMGRSERLLAAFHGHIGDSAGALDHAVRAVELLADDDPPALRADYLMTLASALSTTGSYEAAQERMRTVLSIADQTGDVSRRLAALNVVTFDAYLVGDVVEAMASAREMQASAERHRMPLFVAYVDTIARAHMLAGQHAEAEELLLAVLDPEADAARADVSDRADALLTLAECRRHQGALGLAEESLDAAQHECEMHGLNGALTQVMEERALLLAARGEYRAAYEQHVEYHDAKMALLAVEREARARALQAMFETKEALQTVRQYRELSVHDALTGLRNRRFIDERLAELLHAARAGASAVAVAIVDLDHFKQVNDRLSHETGDEVLRRLAPLLRGAVTEPGFAARMGGEEFLLVLVEDAAARRTAMTTCEELCRAIRTYPWSAVTGDVPVTVSVGVAWSDEGAWTPSELLGIADRRLYASKRSGRDRVTSTG